MIEIQAITCIKEPMIFGSIKALGPVVESPIKPILD